MFAAQRGIGYMLVQAMETNDTATIMALALLLVTIATTASWGVAAARSRPARQRTTLRDASTWRTQGELRKSNDEGQKMMATMRLNDVLSAASSWSRPECLRCCPPASRTGWVFAPFT